MWWSGHHLFEEHVHLELVDGERSSTDITAILDERYPGTEGLASEVDRFLAEMIALGGIVELEART